MWCVPSTPRARDPTNLAQPRATLPQPRWQWQRQWQIQRQSWSLVTFETLITILTIENLNSWQFLWPDNYEWPWTAFTILAMFIFLICVCDYESYVETILPLIKNIQRLSVKGKSMEMEQWSSKGLLPPAPFFNCLTPNENFGISDSKPAGPESKPAWRLQRLWITCDSWHWGYFFFKSGTNVAMNIEYTYVCNLRTHIIIHVTNATMHSLRRAIWGHIWQHTLEKNQTNATDVTLHPLQ